MGRQSSDRRVTRRALLVVTLLIAASTVACSVSETMPMPYCERGDSGLITAQSVPSAQYVPCLDPLPAGWTTSQITIDQDGTEIRIDSDRAGIDAAVLHFRPSCQLGNAVSVPSDQEGAEAFEDVGRIESGFQADRIYLFEGGCVRWEFDFDADASAALSIEIQDHMTLIERSFLNDSIRETFVDKDL